MGAAPAGAQSRVSSGRLSADAASDPWRVTFRDSGSPILAESTGRGSGPLGALGFRTAAGWRRATRVLSSRREGAAREPAAGHHRPPAKACGSDRPRRRGCDPDRGGGRRPGPSPGDGDRALVRRARRRALPGLRRALERGGPAGQRRRELRLRRPVPAASGRSSAASSRPGPRAATTPPTSRCRGCCPPRAMACCSTTPRRAVPPGRPRRLGVEAEAPRLELPRASRARRPPDVARRLHRRDRAPARGRRRRWCYGPWFQPTGDGPSRSRVDALRRADVPASVGEDVPALPALRRPAGRRAAASARARLPCARAPP